MNKFLINNIYLQNNMYDYNINGIQSAPFIENSAWAILKLLVMRIMSL